MLKTTLALLVLAFLTYLWLQLDGFNRMITFLPPFPNYELSDIPSLQNKVILITGGSTGLGKASVEIMYEHSATVYFTSRSLATAKKVEEEVKQRYPNSKGSVMGFELNLTDPESIYQFAKAFTRQTNRLNVLILNAGLRNPDFIKTKMGLEEMIAANHLGGFYLQQLLMPLIEKSAPSRIVILSSGAHSFFANEFHSIKEWGTNEKTFIPMAQYGNSKLLNVLHAVELNRRLKERNIKNVYVNAVHPGIVMTDIGRNVDKVHSKDIIKGDASFFEKLWANIRPFLLKIRMDQRSGSVSQLYAALSKEIEEKNISGEYIVPQGRPVNTWWMKLLYLNQQARDAEKAKRAFDESLELIKNFKTL